jgi:hypothetical protein
MLATILVILRVVLVELGNRYIISILTTIYLSLLIKLSLGSLSI